LRIRIIMLAAGLIAAAPAAFAGPPIFQPGAPGQPSRTITAEESVEMSRSRFTEGDVRFMQHMIVHHAQAVDMVALMDGRGEDASVRRLGERIARSQAAEMDLMSRTRTCTTDTAGMVITAITATGPAMTPIRATWR
jgi:uncharacterized protein (DUF305 family)